MRIETYFQSLNISDEVASKISNHLEKAQGFVVPNDTGIEGAFLWLSDGLSTALPKEYAHTLLEIVADNPPDEGVVYAEEGYDSCQSRRKVAKVAGEAIFLGGMQYEFALLGMDVGIADIQSLTGSDLMINSTLTHLLPKIAEEFGASQDFLFPGVTPSNKETAPLKEYTYKALQGKPVTSVRNLTGVGGVRHDRDWNFVTDFATFIKLKIAEDKRYYPGIGVYYALLTQDVSNIPLIQKLTEVNPELHRTFMDFSERLKSVGEKKYEGVSVLCSAYLPSWSEAKKFQGLAQVGGLELAESFHSPAYEFSQLLSIFTGFNGLGSADIPKKLSALKSKFSNLWSFNSTIHLSWTSELAGLSNDLIGSVTNFAGDYTIRYGVGHNGKSLEIREYNFGSDRKFPHGLSGRKACALLVYPESGEFMGERSWDFFIPRSSGWQQVQKNGFVAFALKYLEDLP